MLVCAGPGQEGLIVWEMPEQRERCLHPGTSPKVDCEEMHRDRHTFFLSANGVWLTVAVPPGYLSRM
jgi:hypothetical protein